MKKTNPAEKGTASRLRSGPGTASSCGYALVFVLLASGLISHLGCQDEEAPIGGGTIDASVALDGSGGDASGPDAPDASDGATDGGPDAPADVTSPYAEDHFVTQDGTGAMNGRDWDNAFSVTGFNDAANWSAQLDSPGQIGPGDTVYFRGTFTTKVTIQESGTVEYPITLDGYEPDNTTYGNLSEEPGRALFDLTQTRNSENIAIAMDDKNHIRIEDFEVTDSYEAIAVGGSSSYITIERCFGHTLSRNLVHIGEGTAITIGGSSGNGCVAKNIGQSTADADIVTVNADNLVISYNHLYADSTDYGTDGITFHSTHHVVIEYNSIHHHNDSIGELGENGIDLKQDTHDIIIRYNEIYGHEYEADIILNGRTSPPQSADRIYIYGNRFYGGNTPGITSQSNTGEFYEDVHIFSNIFHNMGHRAISLAENGNYLIFNNIIGECASNGQNSYDAGVYIGGSGAVLHNNIYYRNRPGDDSHRQLSVSAGHDIHTISNNNRYYWPGHQSIFRWGDAGTLMTLAQVQSGNTEGLPQEIDSTEGDPGLAAIDANDYRIAGPASAVVGTGIDLGSGAIATLSVQGVEHTIAWDIALHPDTDWSTTPPTVVSVGDDGLGTGRDIYGWDMGPYVLVP